MECGGGAQGQEHLGLGLDDVSGDLGRGVDGQRHCGVGGNAATVVSDARVDALVCGIHADNLREKERGIDKWLSRC